MVMTINLDSPDAAIDGGDLARLRRMKLTATGFLAAAAAIYALTFIPSGGGSGVLGFVRAGSEAAMVGGLADWFAVTALFRRPLHLPIPHTAIIPQKKDEIATKLGEFVTANFLTPELMTRHLADAHVVAKIGAWLCDPVNADNLGAEVSHAAAVALEEIDEDAVFDYVLELARSDLARRSYAPVLGQVLGRAVEGDAQRPLVDMVATRARAYIRENRATLRPQIKDWLESKHFVAWLLITDKRTDWLIDRSLLELDEIGRDSNHPLRRRLDDLLRSLAVDLETNHVTAARVDLAVRRLYDDERFQEPVRRFVEEATESFRSSLEETHSGLAVRVSRFIQDIGKRVGDDAEFEASLEGWLRRAVIHAIREYGDELTVLIRRTVAGWNPTSASRRIEVAVGRDLQFIRINGTVVGALAGLAIHTITLAFP
jgi:uncharacterized membrane-anchored protein YjiN (DUF445 family)